MCLLYSNDSSHSSSNNIKKLSVVLFNVCVCVCMGHNESGDLNDLMNKMRFHGGCDAFAV